MTYCQSNFGPSLLLHLTVVRYLVHKIDIIKCIVLTNYGLSRPPILCLFRSPLVWNILSRGSLWTSSYLTPLYSIGSQTTGLIDTLPRFVQSQKHHLAGLTIHTHYVIKTILSKHSKIRVRTLVGIVVNMFSWKNIVPIKILELGKMYTTSLSRIVLGN